MKRFFVILTIIVSFGFGARFARADVIGEPHTFSISPQYDARGRSQLNATLRGVSDRAYLYVADDYWDGLDQSSRTRLTSAMTDVGREFDERIYPIETAFFGPEPNPGIDGDARITLLFAALGSNAGGYFDSAHEYPRSQVPYSNEREMLYINTTQLFDLQRVYAFLAHEFQHLISFNQKEQFRGRADDVWLNELRSEYAITLVGYQQPYMNSNLERRTASFLQNPSDSLTEWPNQFSDYGQVAVFAEYLAKNFSPRVIADTLTTVSSGIASVNEALARNGFTETFDDVFASWMVANLVNNPLLDSRYSYAYPLLTLLRVNATQVVQGVDDTQTVAIAATIKDWEQRWYDIYNLEVTGKSALAVNIESSADLRDIRMPYLLFLKDGTVRLQTAFFTPEQHELIIPDIGKDVIRVTLMPYKRGKLVGFGTGESASTISLSIRRTDAKPAVATPEQFGLDEGDFIRAEGDKDVYIVNNYGFKRIVLSPTICLQYGHLGARGCFSAVRVVPPSVRDAFATSPYYTNGETKNGVVFQLIETGEDSAYLQVVNRVVDHSVFLINTREQKTYTR